MYCGSGREEHSVGGSGVSGAERGRAERGGLMSPDDLVPGQGRTVTSASCLAPVQALRLAAALHGARPAPGGQATPGHTRATRCLYTPARLTAHRALPSTSLTFICTLVLLTGAVAVGLSAPAAGLFQFSVIYPSSKP